MGDPRKRCPWADSSTLIRRYHDREWGLPEHDDRRLFELLILEGAQAGLSWETVLKKRTNYRHAFDDFDPAKVSRYTEVDVERLLANPGIIRNRRKIMATIGNAQSFLDVQAEFGSFDRYIWGFVGGSPIRNAFTSLSQLPAETEESAEMSRGLRWRGFKFVGPTICYAFMQAAGMVNDHLTTCFRYDQL